MVMSPITILSILLYSVYCTAQNVANVSIGDDRANWIEMWKIMSKSNDGRSAAADSSRPALFDIILRANAQARRKIRLRSGETEFMFQGDIAMNKRDVLGILNRSGKRRKRAVMRKIATNLWQPHKLAYVISSDLGKSAKQAILAAIKQWEDTLPCMGKWKDISRLDSSKRPRDFIRFIKGEGCYSRVGRRGGRQAISIGTGCEHVGVVIHEIGHAMGFWHEQSRTDRDKYVEIHWNNIIPGMRFNFDKYTPSRINDLGVGYDYKSVMHYGSKAFSIDGQSVTISIKKRRKTDGIRLGQRYSLSEMDKKQARLLYGCNVKPLPCSSYPCLNGGICRNNVDSYSCRCMSGYTGIRCEKRITQVCVDTDSRCDGWGKAGYCSPEKGYEDFMKKSCCVTCRKHTNAKPCRSSPCLNNGLCQNIGDFFSCRCASAYTGIRCEQKVSPCSSFPCLNAGVCRSNGDKYSCRCSSGYTGARCEIKKATSTTCTRNVRSTCESWKRHCVNYNGNTYYSFMKKNCCKTCNEYCKDKHKYCKQWSKSFCHVEQFKEFMKTNCPLACKYQC